MTERRETVTDLARDPAFDRKDTRLIRVRMERPRERSRYHAWRLDRGLQIHVEVDHVANGLHHRLTLCVLTGATERHERAPTLHQQRRVRREPRTPARRARRLSAGRRP